MNIQKTLTRFEKIISRFDLELIVALSIKKEREYILTHPEYEITASQFSIIQKLVQRRIKGEPIAYILGHKEFYGLDFIVNKHTLIPRPETEMMVDEVLHLIQDTKYKIQNTCIVDVGTGSGNIPIAIMKNISESCKLKTVSCFAVDISKEALKIAKKNAKLHGADKKIKFLHGSLLDPLENKLCSMLHVPCSLIITANLPYLSKEIYQSAPIDVKNFEPKTALYSPEAGLRHYRKLLMQLKEIHASCAILHVSCYMEISPEQKSSLQKLIQSIFPKAKIVFKKDLAGKWRLCITSL